MFLHITLLVIAFACFILGYQNVTEETYLDSLLFTVGILCLICLPLNKRGYYRFTASYISGVIFLLITFSLIDGIGLRDAGLIAYPIFIIFTSFLFNKWAAPITTLLSIISVALVYYLDRSGYLTPPPFSLDTQFIVIITLFIVIGLLLWTMMDSREKNLSNIRAAYDMTLAGWAKALEYRDRETEGHSQRVTELCVQLAKSLGVPDHEIPHLRRGALLHDIGKLGIPDHILHKESDLSAAEWETIKKHPEYAKSMLEDIDFLKPAIDIPYCHHEHWDGSGYPEGLAGQAIPLAARIFAVIDVWDALLSDRPYRKAWKESEVILYLNEQAGKYFDPQIVRAFLDLIKINATAKRIHPA